MSNLITQYQPRAFQCLGVNVLSGFSIKLYTIRAARQADIKIEPVLGYAESVLSNASFQGLQPYDMGYLIYHAGEDSNWLLIRLWVKGDIVAGFVYSCENEKFSVVEMPLIECVWESVVTQHERDAWVAHMMQSAPNKKAYLLDQLDNGLY